jgi:hypothetical protein
MENSLHRSPGSGRDRGDLDGYRPFEVERFSTIGTGICLKLCLIEIIAAMATNGLDFMSGLDAAIGQKAGR